MSKEWLGEIKQRLVLLHNAADVDDETKNYIFEGLKVEWLIDRVQELEEDVEYLSHNFGIEAEQNKRYREAIEKARERLIKLDERIEYHSKPNWWSDQTERLREFHARADGMEILLKEIDEALEESE